jgi:protocatechuate 3,4-dioxygenase beta subunit
LAPFEICFKSSVMKYYFLPVVLAFTMSSCAQSNSQDQQASSAKRIGNGCEGCEVIYKSPIPFDQLSWIDTLPDFNEKGPKLVISGTVYKQDGITPAAGVILYVYHTDQTGHYFNKYNEEGYAAHHGYIKGWIKTNDKGQYKFYTLKPAPYPGTTIPAHIHPVIKEPGKNEYWIDEYLFEGDPFLTKEERNKQKGRGGNGILQLKVKNGMLYGERNIILGKAVPNYYASPGKKLLSNNGFAFIPCIDPLLYFSTNCN